METYIIKFTESSTALSVPLVHSFSGIFGFWGLILLRSFTRQDGSTESINLPHFKDFSNPVNEPQDH